eukprot:4152528-Heterocapsa_arctica.AAC.1
MFIMHATKKCKWHKHELHIHSTLCTEQSFGNDEKLDVFMQDKTSKRKSRSKLGALSTMHKKELDIGTTLYYGI